MTSVYRLGQLIKLATGILVSVFLVTNVNAATTDWQDIGGGKARLVAMFDPVTQLISGAIEVKLLPGWKTYWRNPGSSGIPPDFDFAGSNFFKAGEVKFPTPQLLEAGGATFAGYMDHVAFPFEGNLSDLQSGLIKLVVFLGVCEEICIPASASFEIPSGKLLTSDAEAYQAIEFAKRSLPTIGVDEARVLKFDIVEGNNYSVTIGFHDQLVEPILFVEGPENWYLPPAILLENNEKTAVFNLDLSDTPKDADPKTTLLRYTLVNRNQGFELKP